MEVHSRSRVLVVEDHDEIRDILIEILNDVGYEASGARDGVEAVGFMESPSLPDLIILDLMMPRMSGLEFLQELRTEPTRQAIPVMIYSAHSVLLSQAQAQALGASCYLAKNCSVQTLLDTVSRYCPADGQDTLPLSS